MWTSIISGIFIGLLTLVTTVQGQTYQGTLERKSHFGFVFTTCESPGKCQSMYLPIYHRLSVTGGVKFTPTTYKMDRDPLRFSRHSGDGLAEDGYIVKGVGMVNECCAIFCAGSEPFGTAICGTGSGYAPKVPKGVKLNAVAISCDSDPSCVQ
ncbi:MAG: hypothetical protein M1823_000007 [Watsoniomyces obsoletus]|nr:MAG: hypothetical protein M1823_000007 [Watsoniomyces obsoletus]